MSLIIPLRLITALIGLWIIYVVIETSLKSNLFTEWNFLASIPWMRATLWDFYANVFFIYAWVFYKERNWGLRALWLVLLVCLGSIATALYVFIQLMKVKKDEPLSNVLLRRAA